MSVQRNSVEAAPGLLIAVERFDSPVAQRLIAEVQLEYVERYGGPDETPVDPDEFTPPHGLFLVAWRDGEPVGCGGWRVHHVDGADRTDAEIKRMYVVRSARRRGISRHVLAALEGSARAAGHLRMILETGERQPEAIGLYTSSGYRPIAGFGYYQCAPESVHLAKELSPLD